MNKTKNIESAASCLDETLRSIAINSYKKYLFIFFGFVAGLSAILIAINWWIDPLQFYRRATYPPYLIGQKRFQNPGLAKHHEYNAVIIGTSVSENFRARLIKENLGFDSINFSMQGASAHEQSLMLQLALRTGKVKNVIWDVQYEYLRGDPKWVANYDGTFPYYFYDNNPLNEIHNYLLNIDTTKSSLKVLLKKCGVPAYRSQDLEELYTWDNKKKFGKASVQKAWERAIALRPVLQKQIPEYALDNLNANFDINFLSVIKKHPEIRFYLYFPPFTPSYYVNVMSVSPVIFQNMLENKKYIFEQVRNLKNVQLYDFQTLPDTILKVENFCDAMHFNSEVNKYIIESMASHRQQTIRFNEEELKAFVAGPKTAEWMEDILR